MYKLKIRKFRRLKKITQKNLASKIGISQNFLSEIENGKYDMKLSLLYKIGEGLGVCPKDLLECRKCRICKRTQK